MYKKTLLTIFLISTLIYAEERSPTISQNIVDKNRTNVSILNDNNETNLSGENNLTLEQNLTILKNNVPPVEKKTHQPFSPKQMNPILKNFNMTKGDSQKGENIFIRKLKKICQTSSYKFTTRYDQEEWEEIAQAGKFREVIFQLCQSIKELYQDEWSPDLYQFAYEHANDS